MGQKRRRGSERLFQAVAGVVISALAALSLAVLSSPQVAHAMSGSDFDPGNIISDQNFFDASSMGEDQIQSFLQSMSCTPRGNVPCLKDYRQTTRTVAAVGGAHCKEYTGAPNERASRILAKVAQACGINPKVLLVLLQKEQSLITSPSVYGYERAMGWGCPDSGPNWSANCDANYFGFFNQTYQSAWQFRQYTQYPVSIPGGGTRAYRIGAVYVQYHPDPSCGGSYVNIQNQATANLYLYTPYQPNRAALSNLYGTGDGCSSYGNRNFWRLYYEWFGIPTGPSLSPIGNFEVASATPTTATFRGWTLDPETAASISVHLYINGFWGGSATASSPRLDVGLAYPSYGSNHGFDFTVPIQETPEPFEACIYAINVGKGDNVLLGCRTVTKPTGSPLGNFEAAGIKDGSAQLSGWVLDPDVSAPIAVHAYVNGQWGGSYMADKQRDDVARSYPGYGSAHGFSIALKLPVGTSDVCLYGIDSGGGANASLGCKVVSTASGPPIGNIDGSRVSGSKVTISGWALDPDTPDPIDVHLYVDGGWGGATTALNDRTDVAAAYLGYGSRHGFSMDVAIPGGTSTVCAYGINVRSGYNALISCVQVKRPSGPPFGNFESASVNPDGGVILGGWAIDPDTTGPVPLHVYLNGQWGGSFTAGGNRADVGAAYPAYGPDHGFQIPLTVAPGRTEACVFAIDEGSAGNPLLGCKTIVRQ